MSRKVMHPVMRATVDASAGWNMMAQATYSRKCYYCRMSPCRSCHRCSTAAQLLHMRHRWCRHRQGHLPGTPAQSDSSVVPPLRRVGKHQHQLAPDRCYIHRYLHRHEASAETLGMPSSLLSGLDLGWMKLKRERGWTRTAASAWFQCGVTYTYFNSRRWVRTAGCLVFSSARILGCHHCRQKGGFRESATRAWTAQRRLHMTTLPRSCACSSKRVAACSFKPCICCRLRPDDTAKLDEHLGKQSCWTL